MNNWATTYIQQLKEGKTITIKPKGNSMTPIIKSGQLCKIAPLTIPVLLNEININDVVLCKVNGKVYLHKVEAITGNNQEGIDIIEKLLIGNNHGRLNGWANIKNVYGILIN
jgi:hypothetical protein